MFEWDAAKAAANPLKHGVSFDEAASGFRDVNSLDGPDIQHSVDEARALRIGRSFEGRVIVVAYTVRRREDAEIIRIISARRASRKERKAYAETHAD